MKHWVNNLFAAVDIDVTGKDGDIVGICMAIVNTNLQLDPRMIPLQIEMYSDKEPILITRKLLKRYNNLGISQGQGRGNLVKWFESLNLKENRRIIPLSYNWPFKRAFLADWLGLDFDYIFDSRYRDIMCLASCMNDRAYQHLYDIPYTKVDLNRLANNFNLIHPTDLGMRVFTIIKLYRYMLGK